MHVKHSPLLDVTMTSKLVGALVREPLPGEMQVLRTNPLSRHGTAVRLTPLHYTRLWFKSI